MPFFRKSTLVPLAVAMTGVKMGDQLLLVGFADRALLVDVASKVGLSGRAAMVVHDDADAARATDAAARAGLLVDVETTQGAFSLESASFDLAVIDNTNGWLTSAPERRITALQETFRTLRSGGRCIVVDAAPRAGLLGAIGRPRESEPAAGSSETEGALKVAGFSGVRVLTEREGRRFVEGTRRAKT
jgi:methyltransferase family protein